MRALLRTRLLRATSLAAAVALFTTTAFSSVAVAMAAEPTAPPAADASVAPAGSASVATSGPLPVPAGAAEVVSRRSEHAKHYRLSDGTMRAIVSAAPVHFQDARGVWKDIDTHLVASATPGVYRNAAAGFTAEIGPADGRAPVRLARGDWSVSIDLAGAREGSPLVIGNRALFASVAPDTDLAWTSTETGVKDELILKSSAAPDTFTFTLATSGADMVQVDGAWAMRSRSTGDLVAELAPIYVHDSSEGTTGVCAGATAEVIPTADGATVTCRVPRAWMEDAARTWPVVIDPVVNAFTRDPYADTFVYAGSPGTAYGSYTWLGAGRSGADYRTLVRFPVRSMLPAGAYVTYARFSLYKYYASAGATMYLDRVTSDWGDATTWSGQPAAGPQIASQYQYLTAAWVDWDVRAQVQEWIGSREAPQGSEAYGFRVRTDTTKFLQFYSEQTSGATLRPTLSVDYEEPTATGTSVASLTGVSSSYRFGDTISATVHVATAVPGQVSEVLLGPNHAGASSSRYRGLVGYFASDPGAGWSASALPQGGFIAASTASADHPEAIELIPSACSVTSDADSVDVTFAIRIHDAWQDVQASTLDTRYAMTGWASGWETHAPSFDVLPAVGASVDPSSSGFRGLAWFTEDADGDGVADTTAESGTAGRGAVDLSWPSAGVTATSYQVFLFDGNAWRSVATTTGLSFTTEGAAIYPKDSQIAAFPSQMTTSPFCLSGALDLRDDPIPLYAKTAGSLMDAYPAYLFKVVPANSGGTSPLSACATFTVELPKRSLYVNGPASDTTADLGEMAGHAASAILDSAPVDPARFELSATDLSIASFGPGASVSRTYRSDVTTSTCFAPGWRFSFEQTIESDSGGATYIDASGVRTRFALANGVYRAPKSVVATLTRDPMGQAEWELQLKGGETIHFDQQERVMSETDRHGSAVTYSWGTNLLSIEAANGRTIEVAFSGSGRVTSASITTTDGVRAVAFDAAGASVTTRAGLPDAATTAFSYDNSSRIATVSVPGFSPGGVAASWTLSYSAAGAPARVHYPHASSVAERDVTFTRDDANRTSEIARPARVGDAATDTTVHEHLSWHPDGSEASRTTAATGTHQGTSSLEWGCYGGAVEETSAAGVVTRRTFDSRGNELTSTDAEGHTTTTVYGAFDLPLTVVDPRGAVTENTYNSAGDLSRTTRTLSATETAETTYTFDTYGRMTSESARIASGVYAITDYSFEAHPLLDEATTVTRRGVALSATSSVDLVTVKDFNDFGDAISETDAAGVLSARTLDDWGRVLSETDASGTVTHHAYDLLGRETETSRTAGAAWADMTRSVFDPTGLLLVEESYVASTAGEPVFARSVAHTFDGSGHELATLASDTGVTKTTFDAKGAVSASWLPAESTATLAPVPAQTSQTNADGAEVSSSVATDTPATTTYDSEGEVSSTDPANAEATTFGYDAAGNVTTETVPAPSGSLTSTSTYDLGGRLIASRDASGNVTTFTYDLLDRRTSAAIGGTRVSTTTYNSLGWPLSETDPDGVVTTWTYDREGRTLSRTVTAGGLTATTTHVFDGLGRELRSSDPSSASIETVFDAFGRAVRRIERTSSGALARDVTSSFDAMGRTLRSVDAAVETTTSFTYAQDPSGTSTITREIGPVTLTVTTSAQGREISRMLRYSGSVPATLTAEVAADCRDSAGRPEVWALAGPGGTAARCDARGADGSLQVQLGCGTHNDYAYEASTGRLNEEVLSVSGAPSRTTTFSYTAEGRLAASTLGGSATTQYAYDAAGQITQAGSALLTYSNGHLATMLSGSATTTFTFDQRQRRVSQVSTDESRTLSWDAADRLTGLAIDRGRNGSIDVTASFVYDASGMRTSSVVTSGGVTTTSTYVWNGLSLEQVRSVCGTQTTIFSYLFDEQSRPLAIGISVPETTTPYLLPLSVTARGDVSAVVDFGQTGVASWRYTPYGNPDGSSVASSAQVPASVAARLGTQPLRYAGYLFDEFSGYYCCGARYYDPKTCQFLSRDPAGADGQESAYQYCGGDPVGRVDPSGRRARTSYEDVTSWMKATTRRHSNECRRAVRFAKAGIVIWGVGGYTIGTHMWFASMVKQNGPWDIKTWSRLRGRAFAFLGVRRTAADLGNIHYAYVGKAAGFLDLELETLGGITHPDKGFREPPEDLAAIKTGIALFRRGWAK